MRKWDLTKLYKGFDDPKFNEDMSKLDQLIEQAVKQETEFDNYDDSKKKLIDFLKTEIELTKLVDRLLHLASLTSSVESTNMNAVKNMNTIYVKLTQLTKVETKASRWLLNYPKIEEDIASDEFLSEHVFHINEQIQHAKHTLDEETESLVSKLVQNGSNAWERLQALLTSTVAVEYQGEEITLSQVRNLANDPSQDVRKKAYEAELESYKKIDKAVAASMNSIKGEVNVLSEARGYESALEHALSVSRMKKETLDAMQSACMDYMDVFRKYLKRKGELLGHKNGLPFYDLFAPIGNTNTTFTIEEANEYVLKNFKTFSPELHDMAKKAFENDWIDYTPRKGKVGGAFCANIHSIKESRVMLNFTGAFGNMITMAHELGHAFHGEQIFNESVLNANYTMPVAETASTFCETIVNNAALNDAKTDDERIFLLESAIQDYTQVVVDIMSRFIFEQKVFEGRKTTLFDENELNEIMREAQLATYGDGLDPEYLHPYMWACKPHYYSGGLSYYNFPYTFGLLFAKGLYAKYLEDKEGFVTMYGKLLSATGKTMVEDAAKIAGIDVTKKEFWEKSLELLKKDVDLFLELTK